MPLGKSPDSHSPHVQKNFRAAANNIYLIQVALNLHAHFSDQDETIKL